MLTSLLIKAGMLIATVVIVSWIGWPVPREMPVANSSPEETENAAPLVSPSLSVRETPPTIQKTASVPAVVRVPATTGKLDLNRASVEDLQQLPGIGPVLGQRIVDFRKAHGSFHTVDDLREVKGIGKKRMEQVRPLVMVRITAEPGAGVKSPSKRL